MRALRRGGAVSGDCNFMVDGKIGGNRLTDPARCAGDKSDGAM